MVALVAHQLQLEALDMQQAQIHAAFSSAYTDIIERVMMDRCAHTAPGPHRNTSTNGGPGLRAINLHPSQVNQDPRSMLMIKMWMRYRISHQ